MLFHLSKIYASLLEDDAKYFFEQLVSSLKHFHLNGISYGNIKSTNMKSNNDMKIKLIYFGFASEMDIKTEHKGNVNYIVFKFFHLYHLMKKWLRCGNHVPIFYNGCCLLSFLWEKC
jgi:serine/threonine protein kinase